MIIVGVPVTIGKEQKQCKATLLGTTLDLPAKAKVFNITQFNGKFGCPTCLHEGLPVAAGRGMSYF